MSPYPYWPRALSFFSQKKWTVRLDPNKFLYISSFHPIYVILLRRKPQLRCYYPILAEDHSDQNPLLTRNQAKPVNAPPTMVYRSELGYLSCNIIHKHTYTVTALMNPITNNSHDHDLLGLSFHNSQPE